MKPISLLLIWIFLWASIGVSAHPGAHSRIARLGQLIQDHPDRQQLFILRGAAYAKERQWKLAEQDFVQAQRLGNRVDVDYEWGVMHYRRGDYGKAKEFLGSYLQHYPAHEQALLYLAKSAQAMGAENQALESFQAYFAIAENPHPGDIVSAAQLFAQQSEEGVEEGLLLLDTRMSELGFQPQLQRYAIELEVERGEVDSAIERCRALEASLGSSPQWKFEMAKLLILGNRNIEAAALLNSAEAQLDQLTPTPARRALSLRIGALKIS